MALVPTKSEGKWELIMDSMVQSSWGSKEHSTLVEESVSLVGKCWGSSNEVGSSTARLRQKAPKGTSMAHPNGAIYVIDALRLY